MSSRSAVLVSFVFASLVSLGCGTSDLRERIAAAGVVSAKRAVDVPQPLFELGQALFFDPVLSGNRNIACATCHMPFHHAVDRLPVSRGQGGEGVGPGRTGGPVLPRASIPPFNRSFASSMLWDGRIELDEDGTISAPVPLPDGIATVLEAQALFPLLDRDEMRGHPGDNELADLPDDGPDAIWAAIVARLVAFDGYRAMFERAFPGERPGITLVARALAAFQMQIWELADTRFDDWLGTEIDPPMRDALSDTELQGADLFFGDAGCVRCHDGPLLSDMQTHNIAVPQLGVGKDPDTGLDEGRFLVTGDPADRFAFRTPPLRNVDLTGPYMHDGAYDTLVDAIRQHTEPEAMLRGYRARPGELVHDDPETLDAILATLDPDTRPGRALSDSEVLVLAEFLVALTSRTEDGVIPQAGVPESLPSGLPVPRPDVPD